ARLPHSITSKRCSLCPCGPTRSPFKSVPFCLLSLKMYQPCEVLTTFACSRLSEPTAQTMSCGLAPMRSVSSVVQRRERKDEVRAHNTIDFIGFPPNDGPTPDRGDDLGGGEIT